MCREEILERIKAAEELERQEKYLAAYLMYIEVINEKIACNIIQDPDWFKHREIYWKYGHTREDLVKAFKILFESASIDKVQCAQYLVNKIIECNGNFRA